MKHSYYRFAWMIVGSVVVLFVGALVFAIYAEGHRSETPPVLEETESALKTEPHSSEAVVADDTRGSSTPQGTLNLYLNALQDQNDDEAISYFVSGNQQEEREELLGFSESERIRVIDLLKEAANATGTYSATGDAYTIRTPIFIDFIRYPNGTWKLVEI